jgi:hypothetical protein
VTVQKIKIILGWMVDANKTKSNARNNRTIAAIKRKFAGRVPSRPTMEACKSNKQLLNGIVEVSSDHEDTSYRSITNGKKPNG